MSIFSLDETLVRTAVGSVSPALAEAGEIEGNPPDHSAHERVAGGTVDREHRLQSQQPAESQPQSQRPPGPESAVVAERFARAAWSGIAEPGDSVAGLLVRSLGATAALAALLEQRNASRILNDLAAVGAEPASTAGLDAALERWRPRLRAASTVASLQLAARCGARLVVPGDDEWPESLGDLGPHEPLALWMRGRPDAAAGLSRAIAVVGARAATGYGEHMAMELSAGLADRGFGVVSGAAYGIDGMAHRSALASSGLTYAFLAGGVDRFYPSGHDSLLTRIGKVGVVLSELPCGAAPTKWRFLQRNRLIAAAALATVVVEAGVRSGSLNTAAHAASLGRPLGAVPGPVTSLSSAGCHRLLREFDAVCVTTADEVIELADPEGRRVQTTATERAESVPPRRARPPDQVRILDAVSRRSPRSTEEIARRAGLGLAGTQAALGSLGAEGVVEESQDGWRGVPARSPE